MTCKLYGLLIIYPINLERSPCHIRLSFTDNEGSFVPGLLVIIISLKIRVLSLLANPARMMLSPVVVVVVVVVVVIFIYDTGYKNISDFIIVPITISSNKRYFKKVCCSISIGNCCCTNLE